MEQAGLAKEYGQAAVPGTLNGGHRWPSPRLPHDLVSGLKHGLRVSLLGLPRRPSGHEGSEVRHSLDTLIRE